ncbi:tetratricopeptide repeat protein [Streptomyces sp. NPDC048361]|uniref:tetratricopeptide repeat protein n=1 Tax=Streptomyces sp. NPDC048361 TaxID=3154720 RepID=UPI003422EF50
MGGVGKTQLAAHCARQAWSTGKFDLLIWVSATSREAIELSYAQAARDICSRSGDTPVEDSRIFLAWLQATERQCMVILDDLADPSDIRGLWPPCRENCQVIVTTRRRDASLHGQGRALVDVDTFSAEEAMSYLAAKFTSHCRSYSGGDIAGLAADLGYLPLAMAQAAAYIVDQGWGISRYRAALRDQRRVLADLVPENGGLPDDHRETLAAVWDLSIAHADTLRPVGLARSLLELAAMFEPNGFPLALLVGEGARIYLAVIKHVLGDEETPVRDIASSISDDDITSALRTLHRLSLVTHNPESFHQIVRIHPLIQRITRDYVDETHRGELAYFASYCLLETWPDLSNDRAAHQMLRDSVDKLSRDFYDTLWHLDAHHALFRGADSYGEAGMFSRAITQWTALRDSAIRILGVDHPDTLKCIMQIGWWHARNCDMDNAADTLLEAYEALRKTKGPLDPDTLLVLGDLAMLAGLGGYFVEAASTFEYILKSLLVDHDQQHLRVIDARCQVAYWNARSGDSMAGISVLEGILAELPTQFGSESELVCIIRHHIATLKGDAGDPAAAVAALEDILKVELRTLGPDHPDVLLTQHNLAEFRHEAGDSRRAISEMRNIVARRERLLGVNHPRTQNSRRKLDEMLAETEPPN